MRLIGRSPYSFLLCSHVQNFDEGPFRCVCCPSPKGNVAICCWSCAPLQVPEYHLYSNPFLEKSQSCVFNLLLFFSVSGFGVLFTYVVEILVIVCGLSNSSFVLLQAWLDAQRLRWRIIRQADHVGKTYTNYIGIKVKSPPNDSPLGFVCWTCTINGRRRRIVFRLLGVIDARDRDFLCVYSWKSTCCYVWKVSQESVLFFKFQSSPMVVCWTNKKGNTNQFLRLIWMTCLLE